MLDFSFNLNKKHFINSTIMKGKKIHPKKFIDWIWWNLKRRLNKDPDLAFEQILINSRPLITLYPVKLGGIVHKVPALLNQKKTQTKVMLLIVNSAKNKKGKRSFKLLLNNMFEVFYERGTIISKKLSVYEIGTDNRSFVRFLKR